MNKLILYITCLCIGLHSCVTTDKAITKIASETDFSSEQTRLLATIMANLFPPEEYMTPGTIREDSASYKAAVASLQLQVDQAREDVEQLAKMLEQTGGKNEELSKVLQLANNRSDSLNTALKVATSGKIPCPDRLRTDTSYKESKAKLEACAIKLTEKEKQLAAKEVQLAGADASIAARNKIIEEKDYEISTLKSKASQEKWKWIKVGAISASVILLGLGIFLKLKRIL